MTRIKWSKNPEEWYCSYGKCCNCNTEFMCSKAHYCPGCGEKIEKEEVSSKESKDKSCLNCKYWLLDKDDENRKCKYCFNMDEWVGESEE